MSRHFNSAARLQTPGGFDACGRKRKTQCKHGHQFPADARWAVNWKGYKCRACPECDRLRMQRKRENPEFRARASAAMQRWRKAHPEQYKQRYTAVFERRRQLLLDARQGGCLICGEKDPACLDFHHRDPSQKEGHIGEFRNFGIKRVLAEIAKCDVLCANCHRKHHRDERVKLSEGD